MTSASISAGSIWLSPFMTQTTSISSSSARLYPVTTAAPAPRFRSWTITVMRGSVVRCGMRAPDRRVADASSTT